MKMFMKYCKRSVDGNSEPLKTLNANAALEKIK